VYSNLSSATTTVANSTFANNEGVEYGGAIFNDGATLNVTASTFNGNQTNDEGYGGGIASRNGTANITTSWIHDNFAKRGGGVYNDTGTMNVTASTLFYNEGWGSGGGLYNSAGPMVLTNSTVTDNYTSGEFAGAIYTENGSLHVVNSTLVDNSCDCDFGGAAGIYGDGTAITLRNTILANEDGNCDTNPMDLSVNNYATDNSCNMEFAPAATQVSQDQLNLGNLAWQGPGPRLTPTIKPLPGSVAINGGDNGVCAAAVGAPTYGAGGVDQRGVTRPQGENCDVGAYEVRAKLQSPPRPRPAP
jgi:hypothetical protein